MEGRAIKAVTVEKSRVGCDPATHVSRYRNSIITRCTAVKTTDISHSTAGPVHHTLLISAGRSAATNLGRGTSDRIRHTIYTRTIEPLIFDSRIKGTISQITLSTGRLSL